MAMFTMILTTHSWVQDAMAAAASDPKNFKVDPVVLQQDDEAQVRGNLKLCKGCYESVAQSKQDRIKEQCPTAQLNHIRDRRPTVEMMQGRLKNMASPSSADELREQVTVLREVAPVPQGESRCQALRADFTLVAVALYATPSTAC
jgi:hypothetical protein